MTLFEIETKKVVDRMEQVQVNDLLTTSAKFYWGLSPDMNKYLQAKGESATPLVWSVTRLDQATGYGSLVRNAELNFCTLETRTEILNTTRVEEGYSFEAVLLPMWGDFLKKLRTSGNMSIAKDSVQLQMWPNYIVADQREQNVIWDVLKVRARIEFNEAFSSCC